MANLNVAVIGPNDYAKDLGKKGTVSDLTLYDLKQGTDTVTFIEASKYPERLAPLFFAVSMADRALVIVEAINAQLGESMVMLHAAGIGKGYIILRNYLAPEQLAPLTKGTVLENYRFIEDDKTAIREMLLQEARDQQRPSEGLGAVPIDHFFNVKGVGTVILGYVPYGTIRKHDDLKALPTGKVAQVRSIQKHDDDFDEAVTGDRVGLALKNIDVEDLDRGYVLTKDDKIKSDASVTATADLVSFWKIPMKEGMVLHLGHWMQFIPARVEAVKDSGDPRRPTLTLALEKPVVHPAGSRAVLMHLDGGKLRVAGSISLP
ncbi:EF-Tu/IF-2/RF-3 family GTPase [Methanomassiliicoccus luminyensis]|uniref:EF-Tu/IF-2/RF-3 family GTPase n=1 Tax=Methanomassiliicoccus luminyensis TaxID=1080712 RepID=UPI00036C90A6|nr:EF-Tu/IF-2/RF-3 family GTPase [Methanomassiliicoccus luminyensis]